MSKTVRITITALVLASFIGILIWRYTREHAQTEQPSSGPSAASKALPRLLELGSVTCVPCQMMEKVLESLRHEYGDQLQVDFIDVTQNPEAGTKYSIRMIPTQILFSPAGEELFRHEGFYAKEDILAKFKELGYSFTSGDATSKQVESAGLLDNLFISLTKAVEGSWAIALGASLLWGILSILLSPCHLASIPLIVGFIDEQGRISTKRAFQISLLFSLGILITIAALGAISAAAGQMMGDVGAWGSIAVGVVFLIVGLHLLGIIPAPWQAPGQIGMKRRGMLAAFALGLIFGIALGPCTFAYMAPILAVAFKLGADNLAFGVCLLLLYGLGHCGVIVLAGTFTEVVQHYMNWNERSQGALILKRICGILVLCGGFYMVIKL